MLGSVVLDLAIGMAFIYLLLSLIASAVQEMISAFLNARSANLQRGIRSLLSEDKIDSSSDTLAEIIYKHGLTRGLYQDLQHDFGDEMGKVGWYDKFRLWLQKVFGVAPPKPIEGISNPMLLPAYIPSRTFALAMIDVLVKRSNGPNTLQSIGDFLRSHHSEFQNNKAVEALLALVENSGGELETFGANLEKWYNDAMDRVSGWYKKSTQKSLLAIGLVLAVALNVDSVRVGRALWLNQDIRKAMVDAADNYSKDAKVAQQTASAPAASESPEAGGLMADREAQMRGAVKAFQDVSDAALLPVGWSGVAGPDWDKKQHGLALWRAEVVGTIDWGVSRAFTLHGLYTIIGWVITAVALSLGAPFWFDTLNRFMVVRSTIKPHEKSQSEGSKAKSPTAGS